MGKSRMTGSTALDLIIHATVGLIVAVGWYFIVTRAGIIDGLS